MKALRSDPWLQAFAAVAVLAAGFMTVDFLRGAARSAETAASTALAAPSKAVEQLAGGAMNDALRVAQQSAAPGGPITPLNAAGSQALASPSPPAPAAAAPAPAAPAPTLTVTPPPPQAVNPFGSGPFGSLFGGSSGQPAAAPAPQHLGRPKKPGEWVVDSSGAADADTRSLASALYSAVDGDLITLRPGNYAESGLVTNKSVRVRGTGKRPDETKVLFDLDPTWHVNGGLLELENLRVVKTRSLAGTENNGAALSVQSAKARLTDVELSVNGVTGAALRVGAGGKVTMTGGLLQGTHADLLVRGKGEATLRRVTLKHDINPAIAWAGGYARLEACKVALAPRGSFKAYEGGSIAGYVAAKKRDQPERAADSLAFGAPAGAAPGLADEENDPAQALYKIIPIPGAKPQQPPTGSRFRKDIFRPGRRPGDINQ